MPEGEEQPPIVPDDLKKRKSPTFEGKRYSQPRKVITAAAVHEAMLAAAGVRATAAAALGRSKAWLGAKIFNNKMLRARWCHDAVEAKIKQDIEKLDAANAPIPMLGLLNKKMDDMSVGQAQVAALVLKRLMDVQERIRKGEQAKEYLAKPEDQRTDDEKLYIRNHEFGDKEKFFYEHEAQLANDYTKMNLAIADICCTRARTEVMIRKITGGKPDTKPPQLPPPKSRPPLPPVQIRDSNVVIQSPTPPALPNGNGSHNPANS